MKTKGREIEIKPYDIEKNYGSIKRKTSVDVNKVKELLSVMSSVDDIEVLERFEKMCKSILESNDLGLSWALKKDLEAHSEDADKNTSKIFEDIFDEVKKGDYNSLERIIDFIFLYDAYYHNRYEKVIEYMPGLAYDFNDLMRQFCEIQGMDLDLDKIKKLVSSVKLNFIDGTQGITTGVMSTGGGYAADGQIYLSLDSFRSKEELIYVYFHELLHVISSDYSRVIHDKKTNQPIGIQKSGVDFHTSFNSYNRGFVWLNEAFTDVFAVHMVNRISNENVVGVRYRDEERLLNLLSEKGQINIFAKVASVYFRCVDKKNVDENLNDQWRHFSKEIDTVFGPRFLVKLDIFIEKNGIEKAIEVVEKWEVGKVNLDDFK